MFRFVLVLFLVLGPMALSAAQLKLKSLQVGSRTYLNVTVLGANATDMYFRHDEGFANVKLKYVSEDLQRRFNYDPQAATEAERQQAEDDMRYRVALASNVVAELQTAALKAKKLASTSADHLVDVISDKSPLGRAAPSIESTNWFGEKPVLEGKYVVRFFWTPWSIPCRKAIPELNALSKQFPQRLAVVGVTPEPASDIEEMPEPRPDFPTALDPEARQIAGFGISYIPQVLFCDPKGILLYQGHPSALTRSNLVGILTIPASE